MDPANFANPQEKTLLKWCKIIDRYVENGMDAVDAYTSQYPDASSATAKNNFYGIKSNPTMRIYLKEQRDIAFDSLGVDLMRVTTEIADIAFSSKYDKEIGVSAKLKALDMLNKGLREDRDRETKEDVIEITLSEDIEKEFNSEDKN